MSRRAIREETAVRGESLRFSGGAAGCVRRFRRLRRRLPPLLFRRFPAAAGGDDVLRRHGCGQPVARHAVRRRGVEAVEREKLPGRAVGGDGAVEKERAALRIGGAELHVVADQNDGHALREQALQQLSQLRLEGRVQSARRFVEEQDIGPREQNLCRAARCCSPPERS